MGETLDWFKQVAFENKWKAMKFKLASGVYILTVTHPESTRVILKSG